MAEYWSSATTSLRRFLFAFPGIRHTLFGFLVFGRGVLGHLSTVVLQNISNHPGLPEHTTRRFPPHGLVFFFKVVVFVVAVISIVTPKDESHRTQSKTYFIAK